jgi:DNA-binding transcriptional regulator YiaG
MQRNANDTYADFRFGPSQFPRNRITVAAWMAEMDRQRGARIRALREERSLGREALAPQLEVSVKTLYNWEQGREINPSNLKALAEFFDVTPDYIRNGEQETPDLGKVFGAANGSQLDRIESLLLEVLSRLGGGSQAEELERVAADALQAQRRTTARRGRTSAAKRTG